ncbi:NUDIX domain-containing protein [Streptomyces triticirhizae]|nr:NUDIX domain-containing protein [Streptomyces triticirhizae]
MNEDTEVDGAAPALASGPLGMRLVAFDEGPDDAVFTTAPVRYALVAAWRGARLLLVRVRDRDCWELPGGGIDPGESPREAAVRELWEETGQRLAPERLRFAGFARTLLAGRGELRGAVYAARVEEPVGFSPTEEIAELCWWEPGDEPPPGGALQTVDTYLAGLARP